MEGCMTDGDIGEVRGEGEVKRRGTVRKEGV
jgi:hypothetical protein